MRMHSRRDGAQDSCHGHQEPEVQNPLPLIGVLTIAVIAILVIASLWAAWSALDDRVETSAISPSVCQGMTDVWDCAARTQK